MPDTREGRDNQADDEIKRQQERDMSEARERGDELEPPFERDRPENGPGECHRRGCTDRAEFVVLERYQEETGQGWVEAVAQVCLAHAGEESPANLDSAGDDYVFRVTPISESP